MNDIKLAIQDYIERSNSDYAIMINGHWGIGKTHYFKNVLLPWFLVKGFTPIYVSLYGMNSIDQVAKEMFMASWIPNNINKLSKTRTGQTITELGKVLLTGATYYVSQTHKIQFPKIKADLDKFIKLNNKTILCFDDLERTNINLEEFLGYVNKFVEHDGTKVIIIGNEIEIENNPKNTRYKEVKEKLIRTTINFKPEFADVIPELISTSIHETNKIRSRLIENVNSIISFCEKAEIRNFRVIRYGLESFASACNKIPIENIDTKLIIKIAYFVLAASNEILTGKADINQLQETNHSVILVQYHMGKKKDETDYLVKFIDKYFGDTTQLLYLTSVVNYIVNGFIDKDELKNELMDCLGFSSNFQSKQNKTVILLNNYWDLSDEEFVDVVEDLLVKITTGNYNLHQYSYVFASLIFLRRNNLIDISIDELKDKFIIGIHKAVQKAVYVDYSIYGVRDRYHKEHFLEDELKAYNEVVNEIKSANQILKDKMVENLADNLKMICETNFNEFCNILYEGSNNERMYPVLNKIGADYLFEKLLTCENNEVWRYLSVLEDRYKFNDLKDDLKSEIDFLKNLFELINKHLDVYSSKKPRALKIFCLEQATATILKILKTIDPSTSDSV